MSGCYNLSTNAYLWNARLVCAKTGGDHFPQCFPKYSAGHVIKVDLVTAGYRDQPRCRVPPNEGLTCPAPPLTCRAPALRKIIDLSCNGYRYCNISGDIFRKYCIENSSLALHASSTTLVDIKYNCINGTKMFYYLSIDRIVLEIMILPQRYHRL